MSSFTWRISADVPVVNVAMPSIGTGLHASGASLQLFVGGYAMLLITGARSGDRFGRRRTYLAGVIIFTAASLACALAPDSQALVAFRFVQGPARPRSWRRCSASSS